MEFDVISIALLVSLIGNVVQIIFYVSKVCLDYHKYKENVEEHRKRESYNDLKEQNEDGIWI